MRTHQKHPFGYQNIKLYIENKFRTPKNFEDLVYVSQLMQADAIKIGIEAHRRNMPVNMGTMFWQWNDCWPVVSWSAVDYYANKKAMYYEVKRSYANNILSVPVTDSPELKLVFVSDSQESFPVTLEAKAYDFSGEKRGQMDEPSIYQFKKGNPLIMEVPKGFVHTNDFEDCYWVFNVKKGDSILARNIYLFLPPKDLNLQKATISWKLLAGNRLELISDKFAYGVFIDLPEEIELSDNYFHLLPGDKKIVQLSGQVNINSIKQKIRIKSLIDTF
jgi:beta-mannosidase